MSSPVEKENQAVRPTGRWKRLTRSLGPGIVTGASDDDPSGIATYTQAGAAFGFSTLWTAVVTLPLMVSIQEMCARIGLVTRMGLTAIIRRHYPAYLLWLVLSLSFPAIILNIGADISGMAAVANLLAPGLPASVWSLLIGVAATWMTVALPYRRMARVLQWLCLSLVCYLAVPFLTQPDWGGLLRRTLLPSITWESAYVSMVVALLGTTISPYLFFWQASMEVEEVDDRKVTVDRTLLREMGTDIRIGMFFSNLVSFFIILTAATVLFPHGLHDVDSVQEAAAALEPLAGRYAYILFAAGVLGTGMLAIPVLAGSLSYMASEAFGWKEGFGKKFSEARGFYLVMVFSILSALAINLMGIPPMRALFLTALVYGVVSPVLIAVILHICNNRLIMGDEVNGRWSNLTGILCLVLMSAAAILLLVGSWQ
jgi:NRAMP (natural resistance-associated macrophage protein)-like metal ion transporter